MGICCSIIINEIQAFFEIVEAAYAGVGEIPVIIGVQDGAASRTVGTPET